MDASFDHDTDSKEQCLETRPNFLLAESPTNSQDNVEITSNEDSVASGSGTAPYCRTYSCDLCSFTSRSAKEHLYHCRDEHGHGGAIFECNLCDYASRYNHKVSRHMSVHNKKPVFQQLPPRVKSESSAFSGAAASSTFKMRVKPLKLTLTKNKNKANSFQVTSKSDVQVSARRNHDDILEMIVSDDGRQFWQCRDCMYFSQQAHNVKKHHSLCHNKILECPHCTEFQSTSQAAYYEHLLTHTNRNYVKCPDCSYVTFARSNYEKHRTFHENEFPYKCTVCNFGAESESKIKRHMATQHRNPNDRDDTTTDKDESPMDSTYTAVDDGSADEDMTGNTDTKQHLEYNQKSTKHPSKKIKYKFTRMEFRCPKCSMVCNRRGNFTKHLVVKHNYDIKSASSLSKTMERQGTGKKKIGLAKSSVKQSGLKCSHCSYTAQWHSDLRRHMLVHSMVKRFKCTMCAQKYKYYGDLSVHMRRDHGTEPPSNLSSNFMSKAGIPKKASPVLFKCPICSFASLSKSQLDQHTRSHGNIEKTYQCRKCDYQTYWRGDVGRHLFRHHKLVLSKEASEMNEYIIHRPEIQPTTRKRHPDAAKSLDQTPTASRVFSDHVGEDGDEDNDDGQDFSLLKSSSVILKQGSFVCEYPNCEYKTSLAEKMEQHLGVHLNIKKFMCPVCGKRTNWAWDIVKHMNKVHSMTDANKDQVIVLSMEEAKASIGDYLSNLESTKSMAAYNCSLCGFCSHEKNRVVRHMGVEHKNMNGKVTPYRVKSAEEYEAIVNADRERNLAKNKSSTYNDLEDEAPIQIKSEVPDPSEIEFSQFVEPSSEEMVGLDLPFECSLCGKTAASKGNIKKHYNYAHPYKEVRIIFRPTGEEFSYESGNIYNNTSMPEHTDVKLEIGNHILQNTASPTKQQDARYSNPKTHGYIKPFKCSICGLRSNWKWDLKKHLRSKHPNKGGFVIMLSLEEATETYGTDCSLSHPTNTDFLASGSRDNKNSLSLASTQVSNGEPDSPKIKKFNEIPVGFTEKTVTPTFKRSATPKRWKCSACGCLTTCRRNLQRHIRRIHPNATETVKLIPIKPINFDSSKPLKEQSDRYLQGGLPTMVSMDGHSGTESLLKTGNILVTELFLCRLCHEEFADQSSCAKHLFEEHNSENVSDILKTQKCQSLPNEPDQQFESASHMTVGKKYHFCTQCPFRTLKKSVLAFHMTYHRPSAVNKLKCAHCNYYVSNIRLLHKHQRKWHNNNMQLVSPLRNLNVNIEKNSKSPSKQSVKALSCDKCPYTTSSKNELIYHKQFHRPKKNTEFKCDHCDYWVTHKRLLQQHMRLHDEAGTSCALSPAKSVYSDPGLVYDPSELSEMSAMKQKMISDKISASLSEQPTVSPMKLASRCSTDDKPGFVMKNGSYRKLHKCRLCPYVNIRARNLRLHEMMHGPRNSPHPLMKCPHCDYYVGSKGLLSHHMKVHQKSYGEANVEEDFQDEDFEEVEQDMGAQQKADTLLQISRFKKYGCEKCPYASGKRAQFERHLELHGSRQRYTCQFCDYSVPSSALLAQHTKIHLMPNQNLLLSQSISNLQQLSQVPADVALASALPPADAQTPVTISVVHDHLGLYENHIMDTETKKLYRCDRCPYANVRRDYLLSHLKFHMVSSSHVCPYCDYSAPKQSLLSQHVRVHFCPLPELTDWLNETGQGDKDNGTSQNIIEALKVAHDYQNEAKKIKLKNDAAPAVESTQKQAAEIVDGKQNVPEKEADQLTFICQYCEREFPTSEKLVSHELQHLVGNHFERAEYMSRSSKTEQLTNGDHDSVQVDLETGNESHSTDSQVPELLPCDDVEAAGKSEPSCGNGKSGILDTTDLAKQDGKSNSSVQGAEDLETSNCHDTDSVEGDIANKITNGFNDNNEKTVDREADSAKSETETNKEEADHDDHNLDIDPCSDKIAVDDDDEDKEDQEDILKNSNETTDQTKKHNEEKDSNV